MALSLALDLIGGPVFDGLSASVSRAMDRDAAFTDLLQHIDHTLKSLKNQAGVIGQIQQYNVELGLSTTEIMRLSTEMDVGKKLVDKLSCIKFRLWNFFCCCTSNCAERLRKLNRELGSLFANLQLELIRDIKEILILQRQNRDDFDKMKVTLEKILHKIDDLEVKGLLKNLVEQNSGGSTETPTSTSASGSNTEDEGNGVTQAASFEGLVQEVFRLLNAVEEVKESNMMFKPLLLRLKSTLDCLRPFIEEMVQDNKVLDHAEEELEKLGIQMKIGVNLIRECSSVCRWTSNKKDKYTNQVLELDEFLQSQLSILTVKVVRNVKGTSELIRNIKEVVKRIEGSEMVQNQDEFQGSCDITEPPIPPVEFQGSCDVTEPPVPPVEFQGSCDITEPLVPQERMPNVSEISNRKRITVGLDVHLKELKRKLLNVGESSMLVLTGPAGCGKTTLAKTFCQDEEVKEIKSTNDTSRDQLTASVVSNSTTSNTESNASTSKFEEELKVASRLRKFAFNDLKLATSNFRPDSLLGEGDFGCVFKGWIEENGTAPVKPGTGLTVVVKTLNHDGLQGHKEWLAEVNFLGDLVHPNLIKLIGYCIEDDQRLLVYEFMPRGSLENHLFRRSLPLPWSIRMKIALGAAKGLAFLHEEAEIPLIHRDFKTSNILLDADYNAKLSDFGLAKDGPEGDKTHVSTRVMRTYGYAAPEYVMTGHLTSKSDVYSFGVVLLEMLTGRRVMDKNRPNGEPNLVEWARPHLGERKRFYRLIDPRLEGHFSIKGVQKATKLAAHCLSRDPKARPLMSEVVEALKPLPNLKDMASSSYYFQTKQSDRVGSSPNARNGVRTKVQASNAQSP